jgi:hypothetical protein
VIIRIKLIGFLIVLTLGMTGSILFFGNHMVIDIWLLLHIAIVLNTLRHSSF